MFLGFEDVADEEDSTTDLAVLAMDVYFVVGGG